MSDHKPITEVELKEMEAMGDMGMFAYDHDPAMMSRLIAEVWRLRGALESYGVESNWADGTDTYEPLPGRWRFSGLFSPPHPDYRDEPGYKLAREALGWGPPDEPCPNPSCDGVRDDKTFGDAHRCFKDGRWLDTNEEM